MEVTAALDGAPRDEPTVVTVSVAGDTAGADDFAPVPSFDVTIAAAQASGRARFTLTPADDAVVEGPETLAVTGTTAAPGMSVTGASLTIADDDEPNAPPVFDRARYAFELPENTPGRPTPAALGTVSARDPDGDRLTYSLAGGDRGRFVVSPANGALSYVGEGEDFEAGPSRFELRVTARDGELEAAAPVVVRVVDAPEAPEAADDRAETAEGAPAVIDVLANDRDPDGDGLRVSAVGGAGHGTATVVPGGVRYAPEPHWHGEDRFAYTVSDPGGLTSTAAVRVTVTPVNDAPEAVDDEAETLEDAPVVVDVLANDTDVDGGPLRVVSVGAAAHGAAAVADGGVRYASRPNWHGTDRFAYTIADPGGLESTATVTMTVRPVNDAPEAAGIIPDQAFEEGGAPVTVSLSPYFSDVDGDALTYEAVSSDETAVTASVSGAALTLTAMVTGAAVVTVTAADPGG